MSDSRPPHLAVTQDIQRVRNSIVDPVGCTVVTRRRFQQALRDRCWGTRFGTLVNRSEALVRLIGGEPRCHRAAAATFGVRVANSGAAVLFKRFGNQRTHERIREPPAVARRCDKPGDKGA